MWRNVRPNAFIIAFPFDMFGEWFELYANANDFHFWHFEIDLNLCSKPIIQGVGQMFIRKSANFRQMLSEKKKTDSTLVSIYLL